MGMKDTDITPAMRAESDAIWRSIDNENEQRIAGLRQWRMLRKERDHDVADRRDSQATA